MKRNSLILIAVFVMAILLVPSVALAVPPEAPYDASLVRLADGSRDLAWKSPVDGQADAYTWLYVTTGSVPATCPRYEDLKWDPGEDLMNLGRGATSYNFQPYHAGEYKLAVYRVSQNTGSSSPLITVCRIDSPTPFQNFGYEIESLTTSSSVIHLRWDSVECTASRIVILNGPFYSGFQDPPIGPPPSIGIDMLEMGFGFVTLSVEATGADIRYNPQLNTWMTVQLAEGNVGAEARVISLDETTPPPPATLETRLSLVADTSLVSYQSRVTLTTNLTRVLDSLGVGNGQIHFQQKTTGSWSDTVSAANATGWATMCVYPGEKTYYRTVFDGNLFFGGDGNTYQPATSTVVTVQVKPYVSNPVAPLTMYRTKYYTVYGYLKPRHTVGSYPVRIYKYRYVSGAWKPYGYVLAKASNYPATAPTCTKYAVSMKLPYPGKWRLRAYAPADAGHVANWSSGYDIVTAK